MSTNKSTLTKEQLEKQLNAIIERQNREIIKKHYPILKKLEGTFWKTRNSASLPKIPSDYWFIYTKIVEIKPNYVYDTRGNGVTCGFDGWSFQTTKYADFEVQQEKKSYAHLLGERITEQEFNDAWNKAMGNLKVNCTSTE